MVKNEKILTKNIIGSEYQPLVTFLLKSTNIKRIKGNRLEDGNQESKGFWRTKMYAGKKMCGERKHKETWFLYTPGKKVNN